MTPVLQSVLGHDKEWHAKGLVPGDCVRAVVASILDDRLDAVPHFLDAERDVEFGWWRLLRQWTRDRHGLDWAEITPRMGGEQYRALRANLVAEIAEKGLPPYVGAGGPSPRSGGHMVVWNALTDSLAHDPHPDGTGLAGPYDEWLFLCEPYEPDPWSQWVAAEISLPAAPSPSTTRREAP